MLTFLQYCKIQEQKNSENTETSSVLEKVKSKYKNKKFAKNTKPEGLSVILPEPYIDAVGEKNNEIVFYV